VAANLGFRLTFSTGPRKCIVSCHWYWTVSTHGSLTPSAHPVGTAICVSMPYTCAPNSVKLTSFSQSVLELQALLVELISNFEFSMNKQSGKVRRLHCAVMVPVVSGEEVKGAQMPLMVSLAPVN
jgi:hypothetical protein